MSHIYKSPLFRSVGVGLMIISIGLITTLPTAVQAAEWQTCLPTTELYQASIGATDGVVVEEMEQSFSIEIAAVDERLFIGVDVIAAFYKDDTLVAWMPVANQVTIPMAPESFDVSIPQALEDGLYRMVIHAVPGSESAKTFLYGDQVGLASLDFELQRGLEGAVFSSMTVSGGVVEEGITRIENTQGTDIVATLNNPHADKAVRGGLMLYAFAGSAPDQSKVQRMQNFEIKLVPGAQNQYTLTLDELVSGRYLMQAVYLSDDGAQYVATVPVEIPGLPVEPANAKLSSVSIVSSENEKAVVACIDAFAEIGNTFGDNTKDIALSMKVLDAETGERIAHIDATDSFDMSAFSPQSIKLPLPEAGEQFTVDITLTQDGEHTHKLMVNVECDKAGVCKNNVPYSEVAPNADIIKTAITIVVVAVVALLVGAFVMHRRKPVATSKPLSDDESEI